MLKQTYNQNISMLKQELGLLRSFVIGTIGKDKEGNYNPSFVKKIVRASKKKPIHAFQDKKTFLGQID